MCARASDAGAQPLPACESLRGGFREGGLRVDDYFGVSPVAQRAARRSPSEPRVYRAERGSACVRRGGGAKRRAVPPFPSPRAKDYSERRSRRACHACVREATYIYLCCLPAPPAAFTRMRLCPYFATRFMRQPPRGAPARGEAAALRLAFYAQLKIAATACFTGPLYL